MADHDNKLTASDEALLEGHFSALRRERAEGSKPMEPSSGLLARVLEDGYRVQDARAASTASVPAAASAAPPAPRRGLVAGFLAAIGGAPGLASLTAAALAGVWIGARPPESVSTVAASLFAGSVTQTATDDSLLGYDMAYADLLTDG